MEIVSERHEPGDRGFSLERMVRPAAPIDNRQSTIDNHFVSMPSKPPSFRVQELDYDLPPELIAQTPPARREDARLLAVDRASDRLRDDMILDLPDFFRAGDLLVLNDTKVLPAKLTAWRKTGGAVGGLFVEDEGRGVWRVLLDGSRRLRVGERLTATRGDEARASPASAGELSGVSFELLERLEEGEWRIRVHAEGGAEEILARIGQAPLPPYIRRRPEDASADASDRERYQTVYARVPGAIAAPTAGFHLSELILARIRQRGAEIVSVTLHVGLGTFKPVTVDDLADHAMHPERYEVGEAALKALAACRGRRGRIVAVGTTTVRVLETLAQIVGNRPSRTNPIDNRQPVLDAKCQGSTIAKAPGCVTPPLLGSTDLVIYPPYEFRFVDALLTNFHLPRSTLLALVMAFGGVERIRRAYRHAIARGYRFYSYGDAMLIT